MHNIVLKNLGKNDELEVLPKMEAWHTVLNIEMALRWLQETFEQAGVCYPEKFFDWIAKWDHVINGSRNSNCKVYLWKNKVAPSVRWINIHSDALRSYT